MDNPIEEIKNRLDIVEVIGSYIKLKKAGANYRAVCPFHSEKKPSFFVSPTRQIWKCFGCGKAGDVFGFIKEIEGVEFGDALRILAQKAGVELKRLKTDPQIKTKRQRLYEMCELATVFFQKQLGTSKKGKEAKNYLLSRTISEESIKEWRLGYSPDTWQGLSDFLFSRGYNRDEIQSTGLTVRNEKGRSYDRFRGRIIFPLFDFNSQVIGFTGRVLESQKGKSAGEERSVVAKYVNTPNTLLYDKSRVLYGINNAKVAIRKEDACILVEGQTDVILSHQMGVKNVVASSGTALTPFQLNILKRYSGNLILSFDMDAAGSTATERGIVLAQQKGFGIRILVMPGSHDPADVIAKDPKDWRKIIEGARDILDFYFENTFAKFDKNNPRDKKKISEALLSVIKRIPNKIVRYHWIQKLSRELGVRERDIEDELQNVKLSVRKEKEILPDKNPPKSRQEALENELLVSLFEDKENFKILNEKDLCLLSSETAEIISFIQKKGINLKEIEKELAPELFKKVQILSLEAEVRKEDKDMDMDPIDETRECLKRMKLLRLKKALGGLSQDIKNSEQEKDFIKVKNLANEFNKLTKDLDALDKEK